MGLSLFLVNHVSYGRNQLGWSSGVYVDDLVIAGKTLNDIQEFEEACGKRFKAKDLGELFRVLGIHIKRDHGARTIYLDQSAHRETFARIWNGQERKRLGVYPAYYPNRPPENEQRIRAIQQRTAGQVYKRQIGSRQVPDDIYAA